MLRVSLALVLTAACRLAYAQQATDEETPGAHKKVVPPPPEPAAQPAPKAEEPAPAADDTKKGKKTKKTKKKKGEAAATAPAAAPAPTPPLVTPAAPAAAPAPEPAPVPQAVEPAPAAKAPVSTMAVHDIGSPTWSLGAQLRYITVPGFLEFTQVNHPLNSMSFAIQGIRRKEDTDIVFGLDFSFMSPEDGNWLGNGKNPSTDTEFLQFKGLNVISLEVTWIWHHALNNWAQLEWGAGGGLGIVTGKLMRIVNTSPGCSANPSDPTQCYPMICGGGPCTDAQLAMHQAASSCHDKSCAGGNQFEDGNVPPAIPIIHLLVGGVFQLSDKIRLRVEGGFHDAFFFGAASEYAL